MSHATRGLREEKMARIEIYRKEENGKMVLNGTLELGSPDLRARSSESDDERIRDFRRAGKPRSTGKTARKREQKRQRQESSKTFWQNEYEKAFPVIGERPRPYTIITNAAPVANVPSVDFDAVTDEAIALTIDHIQANRSRIRAKDWLMRTRNMSAHTADAIIARAWRLLTGRNTASMPYENL